MNNITYSPAIMKGAEDFIETIKSPVVLINFCNEAMYWITVYGNKEEERDHISAVLCHHFIIRDIAIPWLKSENQLPNVQEVACAIDEIHSRDFSEGFEDCKKRLWKAYLGFIREVGPGENDEVIIAGFSAFEAIAKALRDHERDES